MYQKQGNAGDQTRCLKEVEGFMELLAAENIHFF
jgi:hypothetical protein